MMVPWCHVGRVCDVLQQKTRGFCVCYEPDRADKSRRHMGIERNGIVAVLSWPWLSRVGGRAVDGVRVWPRKVNSSLRNLAIGCHEADRPRLITAASHQHEDNPGRSRASSLLF